MKLWPSWYRPFGAPEPSIRAIREATARHFGLEPIDMISPRRDFRAAHPRQLAMFVAARVTAKSYSQIGLGMGRRDHSTVIHGVQQAEKRIAADPVWAGHYDAIKGALGA